MQHRLDHTIYWTPSWEGRVPIPERSAGREKTLKGSTLMRNSRVLLWSRRIATLRRILPSSNVLVLDTRKIMGILHEFADSAPV